MGRQQSKKYLIAALVICLCISIGLMIYSSRYSTTSAPTNGHAAYVVNVQKIWDDLPATKQLQEDLQKILQQYHQQLSKIEAELKAEHQALLSLPKKSLSAQELQALEKRKVAFEAKVEQTQKNVEAKQQSISERHNKATSTLHAIIHEKVKEIAQQDNIEIIFSSQNVIYTDPKRDLTSQVYEKVKMATVNFNLEKEKI